MAQFTNRATLSYNGSVTDSNVVIGRITQVLSANKVSVADEYIAGDILTFAVSIVNCGTTAFNGLTITDNLGAYQFGTDTLVPLTHYGQTALYINGILQPAPTVVSGPPLVISGINLPAGGNAVIIYRAELNNYAPLDVGSEIVNTAVISLGEGFNNITVSQTVIASETAYLTITKTLYPLSVVDGGEITYTFVIENTGNTPALVTDNVVVTDTFNPILSNLTVSLNGTVWSSPTDYTYNTLTGEFATVAGQITVPAATYTQDSVSGIRTVTPGVAILTVSGTV